MNIPLISLIIPTYRRDEVLCDTIRDALSQNYPYFEIIIIDQTPAHNPETGEFLKTLQKEQKINLLRVDWASLPTARNYGVKHSKGQIVVFIDDDVKLPADFLFHHQGCYENPQIGAVAGRVFDRMKLSDSGGNLTIEDLPPEAMNPGIAWYYLDLVHTIKAQPVISARGCNMSFRREIFAKYNLRFDPRFKGSAVREESDFCLQLRQTGYQIWYNPQAYLIHLGEVAGGCHDLSTRSAEYQIFLYHNHFLMAFKNLTLTESFHLFYRLFDCQVLGHPPCNKSGSFLKTIGRCIFYILGCFTAIYSFLFSNNRD